MEGALSCCPVLHTAQVRHMTNGPESFAPDNKPVVGRTSEVWEVQGTAKSSVLVPLRCQALLP